LILPFFFNFFFFDFDFDFDDLEDLKLVLDYNSDPDLPSSSSCNNGFSSNFLDFLFFDLLCFLDLGFLTLVVS